MITRLVVYVDDGYEMLSVMQKMLYSNINSYEVFLGIEALTVFFESQELMLKFVNRKLSKGKKTNVLNSI